MTVPDKAWLIAVLVAVGYVLLLLGLAALLVRRAWNRAGDAQRAEIRGNVRKGRKDAYAYLPVWVLINGVVAFVVALVIASLAIE